MITHRSTKRFKCESCSKAFNLLHHYKNHQLSHTKQLQYICAECGRKFATKDRLGLHLKIHTGQRPFKCTHCPKSFITNSTLQTHQRVHNKDQMYMCALCGLMFSAVANLNVHMKKVHSPTTTKTNETNDSTTTVCAVCQQECDSITDLMEHMRSHTCQYACEQCSKSFFLERTLKAHEKTHLTGDDRTNVCTICGAAFNRSEHLKNHTMRRHTHVKPFKCNICAKGFIQSGDLNIHMRR